MIYINLCTGEGDYKAVFGAFFRDFSSDGCYRRSLTRQNKGVMGVIGGY